MNEREIKELLKKTILRNFDAIYEGSVFDVLGLYADNIIGFEIKGDNDKPMRILEQLPQYVYICDAVFLVLGPKAKMPDCLPSWIGVYKVNETQDGFELLKSGGIEFIERDNYKFVHHSTYYFSDERSLRSKRLHYLKKNSLPFYRKFTTHLPEESFFYGFLRKWMIRSIFGDEFAEFDEVEEAMIKFLAEYNKNKSKRRLLPPEGKKRVEYITFSDFEEFL
ncbi:MULTISPECIES: hypothetical protein [unclassified Archaeoglobus]|jgi:hypothetical protein|uniref:hypothetical protein n=1 Tax=unclassified Archaeoglobus TaxID=2643606 RepID=UPI0025C3EC1B|nr:MULTISPECIES: hypothetical protein [unclassified Archaeoglobus]